MSKRLRGACVASATLLLAEFLGSTAAARPPDLPVNYQDDFAVVAEDEGQPTPDAEGIPESKIQLEPPGYDHIYHQRPEALQERIRQEKRRQAAAAAGTSGEVASCSNPSGKNSIVFGLCVFPAQVSLLPQPVITPDSLFLRFGYLPGGLVVRCVYRTDARTYFREAAEEVSETVGQLVAGTQAQLVQADRAPVTRRVYKPTRQAQAEPTTEQGRTREARTLFRIAEQARQSGDLDMAVNCYQETHLLAPTSRYGLLAIERLSEIEAQNATGNIGGAEEQETPETAPDSGPAAQLSPKVDARTAAAREMYLIAERCREHGDLDMAQNCYQETRLLAPRSIYGRQARARLRQLAEVRHSEQGAAEEQETPETAPPTRDEGTQSRSRDNREELHVVVEEASGTAPLFGTAATPPLQLSVPAPARRLTVESRESDASGSSDNSPAEFEAWLRQTGDVLRSVSGLDVDVDVSSKGTLRFKGGVRSAAGLTGTLTLDESGSSIQLQQPAAPADPEIFSFYIGAAR